MAIAVSYWMNLGWGSGEISVTVDLISDKEFDLGDTDARGSQKIHEDKKDLCLIYTHIV